MNSPVSQWIEEDYFTSICIVLDNIDYPSQEIENQAHKVLDAFTIDGELDQDGVDRYIDYLIGTQEVN